MIGWWAAGTAYVSLRFCSSTADATRESSEAPVLCHILKDGEEAGRKQAGFLFGIPGVGLYLFIT